MSTTAWMKGEKPPVPENEEQRLRTLFYYENLDKEPVHEAAFDRLAALASNICEKPIAFINLIGNDQEFKKACYGIKGSTTSRELSFCQFTIMQQSVFEVKDAAIDEFFRHNPNVNGKLNIRFYAGAPLRAPDGSNIGSLCVIDTKPGELTQRQKEALQTIADEVISRYELIAAKRELEHRTAQKEELLKIVSHDMRNPLNGIIGFSELLIQDAENETNREMAQHIERAGEALLNIVNVLLNTDYIRDASFIINKKRADAARITNDVIELYKPFAKLKQIELKADVNGPYLCSFDVMKWRQIIGNLLNNAIKFTHAGGEVTISLSKKKASKSFLVIRISDSGIGMKPELLDDLFTGKESIRREGTGGESTSGLGMFIIKKYVSIMNGFIDVSSKIDEGTTFTVQIPVEE